jgi:outer membrane protein assembly factor BamE (lipoprotein component of BamABCDE complex)
MKARALIPAALLALLTGCAWYSGSNLVPGVSTTQDVRASMGEPAMVVHKGGETWLYYPRGKYARKTYVAQIGPNGVLQNIEQRLQLDYVSKLQIGASTEDDVRFVFGPPHEVTPFPRMKRVAWEYWIYEQADSPWKLEFLFSPDGILRAVQQIPQEGGRFPGLR